MKAEHEQRERDRRLEGVRAKVSELRGRPSLAEGDTQHGGSALVGVRQLDELRRALLGHNVFADEEPARPNLSHLEAGVRQAHVLYQRADYDGAAQLLPVVINRIEALSANIPVHVKAAAFLGAAKLATKVGDSGLAWVAADRGLRLANESNRHALVGVAQYQVACALLGNDHLADAEKTAQQAVVRISGVGSVRSNAADIISAHGALLLLLAIVAARRGDTAFGPTNITIHELVARVALGDPSAALHLGERIDTDALPSVLRGRRAQVHLELGWASVCQGDDGLAVLHLLEAERVAQQAVSRNLTARSLLVTLLSRERKSATPGLRALATRAGVI